MADYATKTTPCGLCEIFGNVNKYCKKCKQSICDNCVKAHGKTLKNHKVVPVSERFIVGKGVDTICSKHGEYLQYHCRQCSINICGKCLKTDHQNHNYETISDSARILKMKFGEDLARAQKHLVNFQINLKKTKKHHYEYSKDIQKQIAAVKAETDVWRKRLDDRESKLIEKLKSEEKTVKTILQDECDKIQELQNKQQKLLESLKYELKYTSDNNALQFVEESHAKLQFSSVHISFKIPKPPTFVPYSNGDLSENIIGSIRYNGDTTFNFDTVDDEPEAYIPSPSPTVAPMQPFTRSNSNASLRRELSFVHRFTPRDGRYVVSVCTTDDGLCWVGVWTGVYTGRDTGDILHINQHGTVRQTVHLPHNTNYTAQATAGDVFVSGYGTCKISLVNRQGKCQLFVDVSGRGVEYIVGLAATRQGDLFVCIRRAEKSRDKVIKLSAQGKQLLRLDNQMFRSSKLCGVHSVSADTFCVQDGLGEDRDSRLVFIDVTGQLIRYVNRSGELRSNIQAIVWDRFGNMIAGTIGDELVHIFCWDGSCKHSFRVSGAEAIHGLSVGEDNILWIGTEAGKVFVAKYVHNHPTCVKNGVE